MSDLRLSILTDHVGIHKHEVIKKFTRMSIYLYVEDKINDGTCPLKPLSIMNE